MKVTLRYFAALREAVGVGQETLELPADVGTVGAVRELLRARGGVWAEALAPEKAVRMACNQVMCSPETAVVDGGEVAFFPPVTGG
ncbi:molybdopterin converting factor subunit 1 [Massilia sp. YIM B02443]|uniref:molybdopterin converting factor subunit 1 n=1 Tax=Massilia sp. YIM B02443 TaxID=3050127 RepID=UPI0025B7193E|nr:molybdopterin converting factor subunit 1 [Massilia sp. YIM B02443]MDN4038614.1 molybdopterin converting factor subunit 1 [Massilia sp. YIM B02443]